MRYYIPYGSGQVCFEAPSEAVIFDGGMKTLPAIKNLENEILESLKKPIGCPSLEELTKGKKNILFLVEDSTRSTPLAEIVPVIVNKMNEYGIPDQNMKFLTAPGTHRVMTSGEIEKKLGPDIVKRFKIYQHDATRREDLVDMGTVMAGDYPIPVLVNRLAIEADFILGLGNIVPHSDAGFSGGAKIVQPGICGFSTTSATHAAAGFCPEIPLGMKEGNPCRMGMEEVAAKVGLSFILNVVKNCAGEICGVFAGDFLKAHRKGVEMAEESFKVSIPERADIVVVSSYPADLDYWQAEKGVIGAYFAVKQGGIIIFVTPCQEGLASNHPKFREWLSKPLSEVLRGLRACSPEDEDADVISAVLAVCNCRARERADIFVVTDGLNDLDIAALQYKPF
jgi:nickel-dependent lactate racemase